MDMSLSELRELVMDREAWHTAIMLLARVTKQVGGEAWIQTDGLAPEIMLITYTGSQISPKSQLPQ